MGKCMVFLDPLDEYGNYGFEIYDLRSLAYHVDLTLCLRPKFKTRVVKDYKTLSEFHEYMLLRKWIEDECKGNVGIHPEPTSNTPAVFFEFEEDAILFKLRWC